MSTTDPNKPAREMTLRESFAQAALQGICADPNGPNAQKTADIAVEFADALIRRLQEVRK